MKGLEAHEIDEETLRALAPLCRKIWALAEKQAAKQVQQQEKCEKPYNEPHEEKQP